MLRLNRNDLPLNILERDLSAASQLAIRACDLLDEIRSQIGGSISGGNRPEGGSWFEIALPACAEEALGP